jgi:uncharacterized membrane protein YecN with MAPEG domain
MKFVHLVAMLAIAQYIFFAFKVGLARGKYGVTAPATSGHEMFDRIYRVQSNTLEQLVCFLPALFVASLYWPPLYMAAIGLLYLLGRTLYWLSYVKDPGSRGTGFMMTFASTVLLILAAVAGILFRTPL